ncbi:hypothetical protein UT300012_22120 [Paraclostridium bifermentans]
MPVLIFVLLLVYYGSQSWMNTEVIIWGLIAFALLCQSASNSNSKK